MPPEYAANAPKMPPEDAGGAPKMLPEDASPKMLPENAAVAAKLSCFSGAKEKTSQENQAAFPSRFLIVNICELSLGYPNRKRSSPKSNHHLIGRMVASALLNQVLRMIPLPPSFSPSRS